MTTVNLNWFKKAGIRAIKTMAQTASAFVIVGMTVSEISWGTVLSVTIVSGIASLLTSLKGLPEIQE